MTMSRAPAVCGPLCQHPSCWDAQKLKSQSGPRLAQSLKRKKQEIRRPVADTSCGNKICTTAASV